MEQNKPAVSSSDVHASTSIFWLLGAIVCGVVVGAFYGQAMWLATDEPAKAIVKLDEIYQQKQQLLTAAEVIPPEETTEELETREATRDKLKGQLTAITAEKERFAELIAKGETASPTARSVAGGTYTFLKFLGETFLRMLKCLVLPLVFTSMICGITSLGDVRQVGRLGTWTLVYFVLTTGVAVFIGLVLVMGIKPGKQSDDTFAHTTQSTRDKEKSSTLETLLAVVRGHHNDPGGGMFPENLFTAALENNVMGLIVFSLLLGGSLSTLGEVGRPAIKFFEAINEALLGMVHLVMRLAPLGIFGLLAASIARRGGWQRILGRAGSPRSLRLHGDRGTDAPLPVSAPHFATVQPLSPDRVCRGHVPLVSHLH